MTNKLRKKLSLRKTPSSKAMGPASPEDFFVPAPKGIEKCNLHMNEKEELGRMRFGFTADSFDEAKEESKVRGKPILMVFSETSEECRRFGKTVLCHPLIVEAAESYFVTLVVNALSKEPGDMAVMARYHEKHVTSPVVRIVNERGNDLIVRLQDDSAIANAMAKALERTGSKVPNYLKLLAREHAARPRDAIVGVPCLKQGELDFCELKGVIGTQTGLLGGNQVVRVTYDANTISYQHIVRHALFINRVTGVFYLSDEQEHTARTEMEKLGVSFFVRAAPRSKMRQKDAKWFTHNTLFRFVPMTDLQSAEVNQALSQPTGEDDAHHLLSPRQLAILEAVETKTPRRDMIGVEIGTAWQMLAKEGVFDWNRKCV